MATTGMLSDFTSKHYLYDSYRVAHLLANLDWVDFDFGCSTTLLGGVGSYSSGYPLRELHKSKSTQPRFARRWATLYSFIHGSHTN